MQERFTFIGEPHATGKQFADWHIDEQTKSLGRRGIEAARQRLAACAESNQLSSAA